MEQKPKKREWVKNAAIIFLAVMLVLTFFSNTIMNRTLPEVVTRYVEPGSIDAKVRIKGTVAAQESYEVIIDQTHTVASVAVKVGQPVSTGDLLFTLEAGDSDELDAAKKQLQQLTIGYERTLLSATDADYALQNRDIELARNALERAINKRDGLVVAPEELSAAADVVTARQNDVNAAKLLTKQYAAELKTAQYGMNHSSPGSSGGGGGGSSAGLSAQVTAARAALETAANELRAARLAYGVNDSVNGRYYKLKQDALDRIKAAKPLPAGTAPLTGAEEREILAALDQELPTDSKVTLTAREREYFVMMPYYIRLVASDYAVTADTDPMYVDRMERYEAYEKVNTAKDNYAAAELRLQDAQNALRDSQGDYSYDGGTSYDGKPYSYWEREVQRVEQLYDQAQTRQADAEEAEAKAKEAEQALKDKAKEWETAQSEVEACQRDLENKIFDLSEKQKADGKAQKLEALDLREQQLEIDECKKKIEKFSENSATEVRAKVNGTVSAISVSAGRKAEAGKTLATVEVSDMGYTLSATVSADQARLLHVGDSAAISNYYWGSKTTAVLSGIQPDPKDPRSGRTLSFDILGDVNAGDTLNFSIGEKNAGYDLVVPNSAVRSDTAGSFVLMITAKNSPLGNRYFATRVDVEVLASDDFNTAVKGELSNMDSVITTSSGNAPVKNGDQVRLADMNG